MEYTADNAINERNQGRLMLTEGNVKRIHKGRDVIPKHKELKGQKRSEREKSKLEIIVSSKIISRILRKIMISSLILVFVLSMRLLSHSFNFLNTGIEIAKQSINVKREIKVMELMIKAKEGVTYMNTKYNLNIDKYIPALSKYVTESAQGDNSKIEPQKAATEVAETGSATITSETEKPKSDEPLEVAVAAVSIIDTDISEIKTKGYDIGSPTTGSITSNFGARISDGGVITPYHEGVDIANNKGTAVKSAISGKVVYVQNLTTGLGNAIKVQSGDVITIYGHLDKVLVVNGQNVGKGEKIGEMGKSGAATGYHLHFAITYLGRYVDPEKLIKI